MINNLLTEYTSLYQKIQSTRDEKTFYSLNQKLVSLYIKAITSIQDSICNNQKIEGVDKQHQALFNHFVYDAQHIMPVTHSNQRFVSHVFYIPVVFYEECHKKMAHHKELANLLCSHIKKLTQQEVQVSISDTLVGLSVVAHPNEFGIKLNKAINTKGVQGPSHLLKEEEYFQENLNNGTHLSLAYITGVVLFKEDVTSNLRETFYDENFVEELEDLVTEQLAEQKYKGTPLGFTFESTEAAQIFRESLFENRLMLQVAPFLSHFQQENKRFKAHLNFAHYDTKIEVIIETIEDDPEFEHTPDVFCFEHPNPYPSSKEVIDFVMGLCKEENIRTIQIQFINESTTLN